VQVANLLAVASAISTSAANSVSAGCLLAMMLAVAKASSVHAARATDVDEATELITAAR
jgi:hypothetical protein